MASDLEWLSNALAGTKYSIENYLSEIDIEFKIERKRVTGHLHFMPFDDNLGAPNIAGFAEYLMSKLIAFCVPPKQQKLITSASEDFNQASMHLAKAAFETLKRVSARSDGVKTSSGEVGELLLFILLESVLKAPCVGSKPFLKMNAQDNVKGSDGIHVLYKDSELVIFYGESKISSDIDYCIRESAGSIQLYHAEGAKKKMRDLNVISNNIDLNLQEPQKSQVEQALLEYLNPIVRKMKAKQFKEVNACLIGYSEKFYEDALKENPEVRNEYLVKALKEKFPAILKKIDIKLTNLPDFHFHYFLLPFSDVEAMQAECEKFIEPASFFKGAH